MYEEISASYSRYSSDDQREESITDQQRKCHEAAEQNGHRILTEHEYADQAVSGTKLHREGLDSMLRDAEAGEFQVLYFHSLSRLARESIITMPMLKRLVYSFKVRIISVTEGIDSARDNWEVIASIMSLMHERYIKELAENVFRGQEGAILADYCIGDFCFGFSSEPIPGSEKMRKGRNAKPRKVYIIDKITAPWVVRIFHWFVHERQSLRWITRELNRRNAPKDHRATTKLWYHQQVAKLLARVKYIGIWPWGEMKNTRDPETGNIRQEPRTDEECEKWTRQFPHLRIIDDETFEKTQQLLEENYEKYAAHRNADGKLNLKKRGSADCPPRHLLSGLIHCNECKKATFNVGGPNGKYLFCPNYHKGSCNCQTTLRRDRAERMILEEIGNRILNCPQWLCAVYEHTLKSWNQRMQQNPLELASAQQALTAVDRKISRLLDRIENGYDDPDINRRLEERRMERRDLVKKIANLQRSDENRIQEPTKEWMRKQLTTLHQCLKGDTPAAAYALRNLVGGEIVVTEIRREDRQRFHLQGKFTICSNSVTNAITCGSSQAVGEAQTQGDCHSEEIIIDFIDPNPLDAQADKAKELYDQGLMNLEIATILGCSRSQITKLLKHWFTSRCLVMPDGRSRRSKLKKKQSEIPQYQQIADRAKELWDENLSVIEIARRLDCCDGTVWNAISHWHRVRGLPIPTAKDRRTIPTAKDRRIRIMQHARKLFEYEGWRIEDIAAKFNYSPTGMRKLIEKSYEADGLKMPDGRSRRHKPGQ